MLVRPFVESRYMTGKQLPKQENRLVLNRQWNAITGIESSDPSLLRPWYDFDQ